MTRARSLLPASARTRRASLPLDAGQYPRTHCRPCRSRRRSRAAVPVTCSGIRLVGAQGCVAGTRRSKATLDGRGTPETTTISLTSTWRYRSVPACHWSLQALPSGVATARYRPSEDCPHPLRSCVEPTVRVGGLIESFLVYPQKPGGHTSAITKKYVESCETKAG